MPEETSNAPAGAPPTDDVVPSRRDRFRGTLLGLAAGDALGTTLEFRPPGTFEPLTDIVGGGPFHLEPGQWTDDTSMALCLAESIIELRSFEPVDQLRRYLLWYRHGHLSSNGRCFDIGVGTRTALQRFEATGDASGAIRDPSGGGNGPLMRLAPVPLAFAHTPELAAMLAADSARTTHGAPEAGQACLVFAMYLLDALEGMPKERVLDPTRWSLPAEPTIAVHPRLAEVLAGSYITKQPPHIRGTGYVIDALEAALWAVYGAHSYRDAVLRAANLGDDADTTAAIAGQLAGALWGVGGQRGVPDEWVALLALRSTIEDFAGRLYELSRHDLGTAAPDAADQLQRMTSWRRDQ